MGQENALSRIAVRQLMLLSMLAWWAIKDGAADSDFCAKQVAALSSCNEIHRLNLAPQSSKLAYIVFQSDARPLRGDFKLNSELEFLTAIERAEVVTQMTLRERIGVSIGLINALAKPGMRNGYVRGCCRDYPQPGTATGRICGIDYPRRGCGRLLYSKQRPR
jgi:hypothetical protein